MAQISYSGWQTIPPAVISVPAVYETSGELLFKPERDGEPEAVTEVLGDAEGLREAEEEPEGELEARGEDVARPAEKGGRRQRRRGRRAISKHGKRDTEGSDLRCR